MLRTATSLWNTESSSCYWAKTKTPKLNSIAYFKRTARSGKSESTSALRPYGNFFRSNDLFWTIYAYGLTGFARKVSVALFSVQSLCPLCLCG